MNCPSQHYRADPLSNLELDFDSLEAAKHFCDKSGWDYYVYMQPKKTWKGGKKSYGEAFSWDKRTRKQTK
jgi:NADH dehydrogenase (ubiquinone) Fe-S protein 4